MIHKYLYVFIVIVSTFASCQSDSSKEQGFVDTTKIEKLIQDFEMPQKAFCKPENQELITDRIYPIGFSKDGKFAYIVEPVNEGGDGYLFHIEIKDLSNDKIMWSWSYTGVNQNETMQNVWVANYKMFHQKLNENKIIPDTTLKMQTFPFSYEKKKCDVILNSKKQLDKDFGFQVIKEIDLSVSMDSQSFKPIHKYVEKEYPMLLHTEVLGFIRSPFEDRIGIILAYERRGYEGIPNVMSYFIAGCNLKTGFEAK